MPMSKWKANIFSYATCIAMKHICENGLVSQSNWDISSKLCSWSWQDHAWCYWWRFWSLWICTWTLEWKRGKRERGRKGGLIAFTDDWIRSLFLFFVQNIIIIKRKSCTHCVASMEHNTLDLILQMVYSTLWTYLYVEMWMSLNVQCSWKKKKKQSYNIWDDVDINTCRALDAMWIRNGAR